MALNQNFFLAASKAARTERRVLKMILEDGEKVEQEVYILKYTDAENAAQSNREGFAMMEKDAESFAEARSISISKSILDEKGKPHMTLEQARALAPHVASELIAMIREVNAPKKSPLSEEAVIGSGTSSPSGLAEQSGNSSKE